MKKIFISILSVSLLLTVTLVGFACSSAQQSPAPVPPKGGPVTDYASLIDNLRAAGATVNPAGEVEQPFFSVKGFIIKVNNNDVQVFEYSDVDAAENEAKTISPDGSSVGTSMPFWVGPPHFYKMGRLIVLYVGEDEYTIGILSSVLGSQFAGRGPYIPDEGSPLPPATGEPEPPATQLQIEVSINETGFIPDTYNIPVGANVVWYNNDSVTHTVTARNNLFDSGDLSPGDTFQYTLTPEVQETIEQSGAGALEYYCKIHPSMVGKIIIE